MKTRSHTRRALALLVAAGLSACAAVAQNGGTTHDAPRAAAPHSDVINAARLLRDVEVLSADDMQGRGAGTPGGAKARAYVAGRFRQAGVEPFGASYVQPFDFSYPRETVVRKGANVVGFVRGRAGADRYLVVSAHYDHLGVVGGKVYNGADDNASGVAALLALAAYFHKHRPAHPIIFVAFDAEEGPGGGNKSFIGKPPVGLASIAMDVNLDMVSHNDRNELYAVGAFHYPFLKPYLDRAAAAAPVHLIEGHDDPKLGKDDWTFQSDQSAFHRAGIPFVYFGVEDHKDYHQPTDDFATISREFFVRATETILSTVKLLDENLDAIAASAAAAKR
ncbi:MAG TPA: M20/M25/M40 family metallo-hydrolase [Pyrinomonadaceae bacterium]|jgi:Zn-dependent M28 family amino/carboxypeptidase